MENSYWLTEGRGHHIDVNAIKLICFDLLNVFEASRSIVERFDGEMAEQMAEEGAHRHTREYPAIILHVELSDTAVRKHLLQLAMLVRTYDDILKDSELSEAYKRHALRTDGDGAIGWIGDTPLDLREACNKVIHASEIRPATDRLDRTVALGHDDEPEEALVYLTGLVELKGRFGRTVWEGAIQVPEFISTIIERVSFNPEVTACQPSTT